MKRISVNPYAQDNYTPPHKEAKEMAFEAGVDAQLEADQEVLDEIIKVVESHQFPMPLPAWWVALKEKC